MSKSEKNTAAALRGVSTTFTEGEISDTGATIARRAAESGTPITITIHDPEEISVPGARSVSNR